MAGLFSSLIPCNGMVCLLHLLAFISSALQPHYSPWLPVVISSPHLHHDNRAVLLISMNDLCHMVRAVATCTVFIYLDGLFN